MQEAAGERGGYLHGRGALDSDDLLYLKEQMEAEEDAERLLRRTEKRAFAAFKRAASLADSTHATLPLPLRVEPKPKSGIRQQDLLKKIVEIKPKKPRVSSPSDETQRHQSSPSLHQASPATKNSNNITGEQCPSSLTEITESRTMEASRPFGEVTDSNPENIAKSLLGIAYESSDED
ncbi:hypothetical protein AXF42_Ash005111 [Apostasia shenzhenica]|uniref:Uncharacterized protein n=1 Tax=Apostasia shenzhenica TaxID=1088818 RepID=A0A2I0B8J7_9ASPA|nr:hypothetical protein AXF42_Ash005111 [Apostasia shenzhenica]